MPPAMLLFASRLADDPLLRSEDHKELIALQGNLGSAWKRSSEFRACERMFNARMRKETYLCWFLRRGHAKREYGRA